MCTLPILRHLDAISHRDNSIGFHNSPRAENRVLNIFVDVSERETGRCNGWPITWQSCFLARCLGEFVVYRGSSSILIQ